MFIMRLEKILFWIVRTSAYILPFSVLVVANSLFFPYITGKNFLFRIIVEIMAAGWMGLLVINRKKYWPPLSFLSAAFVLFIAALFISAIFGADFSFSFWSNYERMDGLVAHLHLLVLFFVLVGTFRTRREWFILFGISIIASFFLAFYSLLEYTGAIKTVNQNWRIISTLGNPLYVAAYLTFHIFLIAYLWLQTKFVFLKWLFAGLFLFEIVIFFLTGGRGAFVGLLAATGLILFILIFVAKGLKRKIFLIGIITILLFMQILISTFKETPFVKNNKILSRLSQITFEEGTARFTLWKMALEAIKERPILGWGFGNFIIPYAKYYDPQMFGQEPWFDRTHNMFLEWLIAGGIVVFLAYILLLAATLWSLIRGVRRYILPVGSALAIIGMFTAYLIQLLTVFDILATYLMFVFVLSFLHVVSTCEGDAWLKKNTLFLPPSFVSSRDPKFSSQKVEIKIAGIFVLAFLLIVVINIKPYIANRALISALRLFNQQQFAEAYKDFQKALKLSRGTIGTSEAREHLTFNAYDLFSNPELLRRPEGDALYQLAVEEMEKQVQENSQNNLNIKHNILLAQLYHQRALFASDPEALKASFEQYKKVIQFAPNYIGIYPVVANLYAQTGNINEAIRLAEKAVSLLIEAGKYDKQIFYSKALFYTVARRYNDAYEALAQIVEGGYRSGYLDPDMMENIVMATRSHGRSAIPFLEKVHQLDKSIVSASLMLAQINAELGEVDQARFHAFEALKQDPLIQDKVNEFLKALDKTN